METRKRDGKWFSKEIIDITYIGFESLKEAIVDAENRLTDIGFDHEVYEDYGSTSCRVWLSGWRPATPEEIAVRTLELAKGAAQQREYQDRMIEQLRAARPEVFKNE